MLRVVPRQRQTLLFSATMGEGVQKLAKLSLQRPVRLAADAAAAVPRTLQHEVIRLKVGRLLIALRHTVLHANIQYGFSLMSVCQMARHRLGRTPLLAGMSLGSNIA